MATKNSGWSCVHTVTGLEYTDTYDKFRVECFWQNSGWNYNINNVSAWVNCNGQVVKVKNAGSVNAPSNSGKYSMGHADFTIYKGHSNQSVPFYATITSNSSYVSGTKSSGTTYKPVGPKPTYTISYNANGGSGAPGTQTKWMNENITLSGERPTRNGYSFQGWGTSSGDTTVDYNPGATYSSNSGITLYAIWKANTYSVTYNANGGSGAPGPQTKTHDVNLTLSNTIPTLANYNFKGWGASASSSAVLYSPGDTYSNNTGITLYAIWELAYTKPRIENVEIKRCNSSGVYNDSGTYISVSFSWSTDKTVSKIALWYKKSTDSSWSSEINPTSSGTSGTVSKYVIGSGSISTEYSYDIRIRVQDSIGLTDVYYAIGGFSYPIDFLAGGKGVAFGKPAEKSNIVESAWDIIGNWHTEGDNRNVSTSPTDYRNNIRWRGLKTSSVIGLNQSSAYYVHLLGLRGCDNRSGDRSREIAFTDDGIFTRLALNDTNWGGWKKLVEENDTGWLVLTSASDATRGYVKYRLKNGVVYIYGNSLGGISLPTDGTVFLAGTLPASCRPSEEISTIGSRKDYAGYEIQVISQPDGKVLITNLYKNHPTAHWGFSMSYPV